MITIAPLIRKELIWISILTIILYLAAYLPISRNYTRVASDKYYYGGEEYPLDMTGDLSYVWQGYHGAWKSVFNYSTHIKNEPTFLKLEYIAIGHFARFFHLSPLDAFIVTRALLSAVYLVVIYLCIRFCIKGWHYRVIAYGFVLFGASIIYEPFGRSFSYISVYDTLVFVRTTLAMHHYQLGGIFTLVSMYLLSFCIDSKKITWQYIVALISIFLTSLFYAPDSVLVLAGFPLYILFTLYTQYRKTGVFRIPFVTVFLLAGYTLFAALPVIYVRYVVSRVWQGLATDRLEQLNPFVLTTAEYVLAMGATYILSFFALPRILKHGSTFLTLLATWLFMHPVGEFLLAPLLHVNKVRFFITPYFVVSGILAVIGLQELSGRFKRKTLVHVLTIIIVLLSSVQTYRAVYARSNLCFCLGQYTDYAYPKRSLMNAIWWLRDNTKPSDVVLSGYYDGALIPAFSGNAVYVSWWYRLIEPPEMGLNQYTIDRFYMGVMTDSEASDFLHTENISYVLRSDEERLIQPQPEALSYSSIQEVYTGNSVVIYKVK